MNRTQKCRAFARAGVLVAALALAPSAFAHAHLYPDEMPSDHGSLLQLAVPNEEENASTTQIVMTVPSGFELGSVATVPGWTATVSGNTVTWKGKLDGEQLALLPFTGSAKEEGDYAFKVSQTYSDGSVVDWAGNEDSDTPAPVDGRGRRARRGGVPLRLEQDDRHHRARRRRARAAHRRRGPRRREALGMTRGGRASALLVAFVVALAVPALAWGHATLLGTQPQASGVLTQPPTEVRLTFSERIEPRFAVISVTDAGGNQQIAGSPARTADDENAIFVPVEDALAGLVPGVVAHHLGRRAPDPRARSRSPSGRVPARRRSSSSRHSARARRHRAWSAPAGCCCWR